MEIEGKILLLRFGTSLLDRLCVVSAGAAVQGERRGCWIDPRVDLFSW
jgi:hypothetical protein